ncbi:MAG: GntR family transcriptional regulator [Planctomycetes bacterium]|nr:GntR family transcriptional regulator [Planctomycetota bacterium]
MTEIEASSGRVSAGLFSTLRRKLVTGQFAPGQYLPPLRELCERHGVARKTGHQVLKKLEAEGYLTAEARKGYRVLARASDPDLGCPLVYVADLRESPEQWSPLHQELLSSLQGAAARRNWTLLGVGSQGRNRQTVLRQLTASRASGLIVDAVDGEIMRGIEETGLPAVAVDAWDAGAAIDLVVQDSYQGGVVAAEHLIRRGRKRIAWLGPVSWSSHSLARVAGTAAGLMKHGRWLTPEWIAECPRDASAEAARRLLTRPDRPDGIVALYREVAMQAVAVARELGIRVGSELEIVGWATEQEYRRDWLPLFRGEAVQPAVVWNPAQMAELAVDRLEARRRHPHLKPVRIGVPVELRETSAEGGVRA